MDAVKFFEERDRMCKSFGGDCTGCDIYKVTMSNLSCNAFIFTRPREMVAIVERWAKEHPRKTRQEKFLEMFPKTNVDANNVITICPYETCIDYKCDLKWGDSTESKCRECRKKYWLEEIE